MCAQLGFFFPNHVFVWNQFCSSLLLILYILQIGLCTTTVIHDIEAEILRLVSFLQWNYLNSSLDLQNTRLYYFHYRHRFFIVYKESFLWSLFSVENSVSISTHNGSYEGNVVKEQQRWCNNKDNEQEKWHNALTRKTLRHNSSVEEGVLVGACSYYSNIILSDINWSRNATPHRLLQCLYCLHKFIVCSFCNVLYYL